jgi:glutaredoxin
MSSRHTLPVASVLLASLLASLPAHALYKVVGPDGKVTYTDQPPTSVQNKVQSVGERGGATEGDGGAALPFELRQVAQRYPVTLYTTEKCAACDSGRQLLRERGIPYSERTVSSGEDVEALQRLTGSTDVPMVSIGAQVLRGFQGSDWTTYLDLAGYPKASKLPAGYPAARAQPLTARQIAPPNAPATPQAPSPQPAPAPAPRPADNPAGIRF